MSEQSVFYKHQRLKDDLLRKISDGEYACGCRIPSELVLAKQFQISRNTVRQALKSLESSGYLYSVRGKGTFVRESSPQGSHKIALVIYDTAYMTHPVTARMICGIDSCLQKEGYVMDVLASRRSFGEEQMSQMLGTYAGFLIGAYQIDTLILRELEKSGLPFLFLKNYLPGYEKQSVRIDYGSGGYSVAEHLIQRGCRNLGLIYAGEEIAISLEFCRGVREACLENGARLSRRNILFCDYMSSVDASFADRFGEDLPDGIICQTDQQAVSLCRELQNRGISVPGQVKVTGCNHREVIPAGIPSLTTLDIPVYELGAAGAERLLGMIRGERKPAVPPLRPVLVEGESTSLLSAETDRRFS